ncbi:MAG: hypothetical protein COA49_01815 [Bacteroidetes bacterium]|nr:MAG: hypothetical protein COA49_01815 [Bacteroidota bacterium]
MNQKIFLSFLTFLLFITPLISTAQSWDDEDSYIPSRQGVEFGVNIGVYRAHPNSTVFYNGAGWYELGDNLATLYSIEDRLFLGNTEDQINNVLNLGGGSFWLPYDSSPLVMPYDPGLMMGLKMLYFWNPESALVMSFDAVNLKAAGPWTLQTDLLPGQGQGSDDIHVYGIFGQERRMLGTLGYRTAAYIIDEASWIFEIGGTATGVQIKRNFIMVENNSYDLITFYNGNGQFSGAASNLTSIGFGFYGVIGLEAMFEEGGNLEANFRVSRDNIRLGNYEEKLWNFAVYVTWLIPPHIGDFVRASF